MNDADNDEHAYEWFCQVLETVAVQLDVTPQQAEERIFSVGSMGRRPPGEWRRYVQEHWHPVRKGQ